MNVNKFGVFVFAKLAILMASPEIFGNQINLVLDDNRLRICQLIMTMSFGGALNQKYSKVFFDGLFIQLKTLFRRV